MLGLLIGLCAVLGLAVGSFLNVVIYRVPRDESIVTPRSVLPSMRHADSGEGQHPGGLLARCSVVAAVTARRRSPCAIRWWSWRVPHSLPARLLASATSGISPPYLVLFAGLLALSCIDVERMILPKKIVYPLTVLVAALLLLAAVETGRWHDYVIGAHLCGRVVRRVLRDEPCQSTALGFRGRAALLGARSLAGVAGCRLRPAGLLRRQPHRRGGRYHPDRDQAHGAPEPDPLRCLSGVGMRRGRVRRSRAPAALHPLLDSEADRIG